MRLGFGVGRRLGTLGGSKGCGSLPSAPPYIGGQGGCAPPSPRAGARGEACPPSKPPRVRVRGAGPLPYWASRMGPLGLGGAAGPRAAHCPFIPCGPPYSYGPHF